MSNSLDKYILDNYSNKTMKQISKETGYTMGQIRAAIRRLRDWGKLGKKEREVWRGCNEDCFNCTYSDCLKPLKLM